MPKPCQKHNSLNINTNQKGTKKLVSKKWTLSVHFLDTSNTNNSSTCQLVNLSTRQLKIIYTN